MPTILFGISGSIAAFKALEIIRLLRADGVDIVPVLSPGGAKFVTKATVEAITGNPAVSEIFPEPAQQEIEHIALAQKADLLVTCPASADIIAKYAAGICDDALSLTALTFGTPHIIAPAMNHRMWEHPATVANVDLLKSRDCVFVGPDRGAMACDEEGWGRLAPIEEIHGRIMAELGQDGPLAGKKIVISAGATKEFIDDVRYLSNRSSGKMGHALAAAARDMGASVVLVTASDLPPTPAVSAIRVESAQEMYDVVFREGATADAVVMSAAVADFAPASKVSGKIKKESGDVPMQIELARTPDILGELAEDKRSGLILVGFAAEYGPEGRQEAIRKCRDKSCDLICLNDVSREDVGFESDENELVLIFPDDSEKKIRKGPKKEVAGAVMKHIAAMFKARGEKKEKDEEVLPD